MRRKIKNPLTKKVSEKLLQLNLQMQNKLIKKKIFFLNKIPSQRLKSLILDLFYARDRNRRYIQIYKGKNKNFKAKKKDLSRRRNNCFFPVVKKRILEAWYWQKFRILRLKKSLRTIATKRVSNNIQTKSTIDDLNNFYIIRLEKYK